MRNGAHFRGNNGGASVKCRMGLISEEISGGVLVKCRNKTQRK